MSILVSGKMKRQENILVDPCWLSWIRVNQRGKIEYKIGKNLEQMWLVRDRRKERMCVFSHKRIRKVNQ